MGYYMNKKCQVFTPENYVEELLDRVGYVRDLYGKRLLENSCGDGNILAGVVRRYIEDGRRQGISQGKIREGLACDIYGVEIDEDQYKKCIDVLNAILYENGIRPVNWKVYNTDYLRWEEPVKFHYVVGNPPYITYSELDEKEQKFVKENFSTCKKGKFDYCYAFIEKSISSMEPDGKMAYLIPSSIFKTVFGSDLRELMKPYIREIKEYTNQKVFDNALVKSSIMVLNRNRSDGLLYYTDVAEDHNRGTGAVSFNREIDTNNLGSKWFFTNCLGEGERRFGDDYKISHVVATLYNEAYVLKADHLEEADGYIFYNGHRIERSIVRETATPRSLRYGRAEKIIFPYCYLNGQLVRYTEEEFEESFPEAAAYLNRFRKKLDDRKKAEGIRWFEYGRSQALADLNTGKLLISTIITEAVNVYRLNQECIPYAGMYIVPRRNGEEDTLERAVQILRSEKFMQYVSDVGIHISGKSLRITSKDIENYKFREQDFE